MLILVIVYNLQGFFFTNSNVSIIGLMYSFKYIIQILYNTLSIVKKHIYFKIDQKKVGENMFIINSYQLIIK